ncbi:hypothetical protein CXF68_06500 [Tenacibaculum sp. Bg11-29]|uniref:hypothetical protein n=1 Tax=Tenacibaculum sp. Bg11-29 TaxID=2058306 RepID=UPI000C331A88|nr:hypothetical protein [Tenacibaculum sp. Bg11-29]PKH50371.1 hypothetical protein CXF68_06500 [Tenacibaculum sp. Bg11-29]
MRYCYVAFLIISLLFLSCDSFFKEPKKNEVNTVVDYSKVDISPSFKKCKDLPVKAKKTCFRKEINKRIQESLVAHNFRTEEFINETILIDLLIDAEGSFKLKKITASNKINKQLPQLDSVLKNVIQKLPIIIPAFKRGIPVISQYQLPIKIAIKEVLD